MALQLAVISLSPWEMLVRVTLPATIAAVPLALWPHRRHLGIWVLFVGLAANLAVVLANGGLMPIERSTVASAAGEARAEQYQPGAWIRGSKDVLAEGHAGRAVTLGDSIVIHFGSGGLVASPGDIVIWSGLAILASEAAGRGVLAAAAGRPKRTTARWRRRGGAATR